jgi:hypothetical protein
MVWKRCSDRIMASMDIERHWNSEIRMIIVIVANNQLVQKKHARSISVLPRMRVVRGSTEVVQRKALDKTQVYRRGLVLV